MTSRNESARRARTGTALSLLTALVTALTTGLVAGAAPAEAKRGGAPASADEPIVIGHRGASGYRPEHTLAAYRLAIQLGADYIEPDLVSTKDGVLVARHENEISGTTDVAARPEFADRRTTKTIDGRRITGWFTEDFTLAELKTLRAKERLPQVRPDNTAYDGRFEIPTLEEVILLAKAESKRSGRTVGIYPETKHPTYFDEIGLSMEEPLVRTLHAHGLDRASAPVIIQSFETANLRDLDEMTKVTLAQLVDLNGAPYDRHAAGDRTTYRDMVQPAGLAEIATYADGLGANKSVLMPIDPATGAAAVGPVIDRAHAAGLEVHAWTVRAENQFLPANYKVGTDPNARGNAHGEALALLDAGVDGIFTDHPDVVFEAREDYLG